MATETATGSRKDTRTGKEGERHHQGSGDQRWRIHGEITTQISHEEVAGHDSMQTNDGTASNAMPELWKEDGRQD